MNAGTGNLYYVLRDGSTREEQWSWADLEQLCRAGEITPRARIFLPDEDRWATVGETRLAAIFEGHDRQESEDLSGDQVARLGEDYRSALERVEADPDLIEARLDAGVLAAQLGHRDEARAHFQTVLHRYPYHARAAQEVRRRFSKAEQKAFRYLERPAPVWDDLGELLTMPLARGPLYVVVPAAIMIALAWVPFGGWMAAALAFLWAFQVMEYTARGATKPSEWNRSFKDPWRKLARPALVMGVVVGQWAVVLYAAAKITLAAQGQAATPAWEFVTRSPVFLVVGTITGLLYLPAAMVSMGGFTGPISKTLDPRRLVRTVARMEHEYVYSVALIAAVAAVLMVVRFALGALPVAGGMCFGAALAYATPMVGLILGRLLGRMGHVIE